MAEDRGDGVPGGEAGARHPFGGPRGLRSPEAGVLAEIGVPRVPEALHQRAGVDRHRAARLAHAVAGTGIEPGVLVVAADVLGDGSHWAALQLAAHDDALAGGERQLAARTDRLAEAALDARVRLALDRGERLEIVEV